MTGKPPVAYADPERDEPMLINASTFARLLNISIREFHRRKSAGLIIPPIHEDGRPSWVREEAKDWIRAHCPHPSKWKWKGGNDAA